ncbi:50S ribosomal protein L4 [Candidatus Gastranaerophilus sp. (ex Termes propinquus)]|nr:50S ribosomal protein L4 [Candidatus Gastranaerophilus sp. (ex Termes propinquus)]
MTEEKIKKTTKKAAKVTAKLLSTQGKDLGELSLNTDVFGVEPNIHVMHLALKRQLNNARQGSANTKTRAEVRGGGRKPWKQKGTGRARAGSIRSPLFAGGGVIFGPKPRDYSSSLPQKVRQLALRSALSAKLEAMIVVRDFSEIKEPKTKTMVKILKDINATGKVLIIADYRLDENKNLELSARNLPNVKMILPTNLNVKDLIEAQSIVVAESAIAEMTERLAK